MTPFTFVEELNDRAIKTYSGVEVPERWMTEITYANKKVTVKLANKSGILATYRVRKDRRRADGISLRKVNS